MKMWTLNVLIVVLSIMIKPVAAFIDLPTPLRRSLSLLPVQSVSVPFLYNNNHATAHAASGGIHDTWATKVLSHHQHASPVREGDKSKPQQSLRDDKVSPIEIAHNLNELLAVIDNTPPDSIVVIKFFASYCRACRRTKGMFKKSVQHYSDLEHNIHFAMTDVNHLGGGKVVKTIGVTKIPFLQMYRNGMCVASFSAGVGYAFRQNMESMIDMLLGFSHEDWEAFVTKFGPGMEEHTNAINLLRGTSANSTVHKYM